MGFEMMDVGSEIVVLTSKLPGLEEGRNPSFGVVGSGDFAIVQFDGGFQGCQRFIEDWFDVLGEKCRVLLAAIGWDLNLGGWLRHPRRAEAES